MHGHTDWFGDTADVRVWDEAMPLDSLEALEHCVKGSGFKFGWKSSNSFEFGHWNITFGGRDPKNREPVESYLEPTISVAVSWMKRHMPAQARIIRVYANAYTFGTEGFPHVDSDDPDDLTALIYLNRKWERAWGGETVFFEGDEIVKAVMPRYGRMVMFHSNMVHAARGISRLCPELRTVFVVKAKTHD